MFSTMPIGGMFSFWYIRIARRLSASDTCCGVVTTIEPTTGTWEKWVKGKDDQEWTLEAEGVHSHVGNPLVTLNLYPSESCSFMPVPVFRDLAWTNYEHFILTMLVNYNLYFSVYSFIFLSGVNVDAAKGKMRLGPHSAHVTSNTQGDAKFVEPPGTAAATLSKARIENEERAMIQGLKPYVQKPGSSTATGESIRAASSDCDAQTWCTCLRLLCSRRRRSGCSG